MNNRGVGAEKVCRFVSTRLPRKLAMTKFFDCARNETLFGHLLTDCAISKTEHEPQRRRANKRRARRFVQVSKCVLFFALENEWHNKSTILFYASAACLPRERRTVL